VLEVPHDPELYFTGEEMSITVRAYTYGYDIFHPHILIAWHEYTRKNRDKQWDDDKEWWKKDLHSKQHYLTIFNNRGKYGIGSDRTIEDYIKFSGVNFLDTKINTEIKYKLFDDSWKFWIKENIELKIPIDTIKKILLDAKFNTIDIDNELNILYSVIAPVILR